MAVPSSAPLSKVAVVVCDSVGCGDAPDAADFGDAGANTLRHVLDCARPQLPNLDRLGLRRIPGVSPTGAGPDAVAGAWGRLTEHGPGKDTMLGHWELMGLQVDGQLPLYPSGFPAEVIDAFAAATGHDVIGNRPASGTAIVDELGQEHLRSGRLILYTSGDSVFQLAAHEERIPRDRLYEICRIARDEVLRGEHAVGRVIARPFVGDPETGFRRTAGRKDFPLPPPGPTALDLLQEAGVGTLAVGKIHDIFAGRGIDSGVKTADNAEGLREIERAVRDPAYPMVFANLVDFDTDYGHRNDPAGYARALEQLDAGIPALVDALPPGGCLLLTADHGNDPTTTGTDHTRERVPLLAAGPVVQPRDLGTRDFVDLAATVLEALGLDGVRLGGRSFLADLTRGA